MNLNQQQLRELLTGFRMKNSENEVFEFKEVKRNFSFGEIGNILGAMRKAGKLKNIGKKAIIESLMMQRMSENDGIVTRYMDDRNFRKTVFPILAKEIYKSVLEKETEA